jgi:hypothetical protein
MDFTASPISFTGGPVAGVIDTGPAQIRLSKVCQRFLQRVGLTGMRYAAQGMKVDTGYARGHVSYAVSLDGTEVRWGILSPMRMGEDGAGVAAYPIMQELGIRRHRVYLFDPRTGALRWGLINWCVRHGFKVWKTATGRATRTKQKWSVRFWELGQGSQVLAKHYINVWGYRWPWLSTSRYMVEAEFPQLLGNVENTL